MKRSSEFSSISNQTYLPEILKTNFQVKLIRDKTKLCRTVALKDWGLPLLLKSLKKKKAYISLCYDFRHVGHLGMAGNSLDPDLKKLLSCAGISEAAMEDSETSQLIYDVIERSGGMEALKKEMSQQGKSL